MCDEQQGLARQNATHDDHCQRQRRVDIECLALKEGLERLFQPSFSGNTVERNWVTVLPKIQRRNRLLPFVEEWTMLEIDI